MDALYNFDDFLSRMATLGYQELLREAEEQIIRVEGSSHGVKGAVQRRTQGSVEYCAQIRALLFFLRAGQRPGSATSEDFHKYRPVVAALVARGQFRADSLDTFG